MLRSPRSPGAVLGGAVPGIAVPALYFGSELDQPQVLLICLLSGGVTGLFGGGIPFVAAILLHGRVERRRRDRIRELRAVAGGAFLGAGLLGLLASGYGIGAVLIVTLVIGLPSALGFMGWVALAWRGTRPPPPTR